MNLYQDRYRVKSTRLKGWDYGSEGWYFVTICTENRECLFGEMIDDHSRLSVLGEAAQKYWEEIPRHFKNVQLDVFVVMPNHIHGILAIHSGAVESVETRDLASLQKQPTSNKFGPLKSGSLPAIIHAYKSALTRWSRKQDQRYVVWQPRYYDHIIRDEASLHGIRKYIQDNPVKWELDKEQVANLWI